MATIGSEQVPVLQVEGKIVIFPAYTFYLQENGFNIQQKCDKHSNRKLNEILLKANLARALGKEYEVPHIVVYDKGTWVSRTIGDLKAVMFDAGKYGKYTYYPTLIEGYAEAAKLNAVEAFLRQYSGAKLSIKSR